MSLYSIGEVARICGINPVTLRAWQRRYGLLKPQRTEGGHRLFNDDDLDTIRTILGWINRGIPVGQVKSLLEGKVDALPGGWSQSEHQLLTALQDGRPQKVRQLIMECGREYPAAAFVNNVLRPLRARLSSGDSRLLMLRSQLDGLIIEHSVMSMNAARKRPGPLATLVGWGQVDSTELWLEAIVRCEAGLQIEILPVQLNEPYLENLSGSQILLWSEGRLTQVQRQRLLNWVEQGLSIVLLGSTAVLLGAEETDAVEDESGEHLHEDDRHAGLHIVPVPQQGKNND
ncbi:MerR family transcriptional regulator [Rahnella perminowiae]|uniref:MerR family transcriptional regulator n=1 Tax=Rahnella perminowiae TaxID=2816244 RepID=UPI001C257D90|nr:MerR family transcriptional regulator [Rahnella perminowiae]MBU9828163.1 MerR family transcriptional regulator [Rahnella perminowiae]MCR9000644.1 MerR family transcriptional regulator [Rahnella perminowiae]